MRQDKQQWRVTSLVPVSQALDGLQQAMEAGQICAYLLARFHQIHSQAVAILVMQVTQPGARSASKEERWQTYTKHHLPAAGWQSQ